MANIFGGVLAAASDTGTSAPVTLDREKEGAGQYGGTYRAFRIPFHVLQADSSDGDTLRVATFKSSDRFWKVNSYIGATGTSASIDVGFFKSGVDHDGPVVEVDTFADAYDISGATSGDILTVAVGGFGSVVITDQDRGKPLWEMVGLSADPVEEWDLVITLNNNGTGPLVGSFIIEATTSN